MQKIRKVTFVPLAHFITCNPFVRGVVHASRLFHYKCRLRFLRATKLVNQRSYKLLPYFNNTVFIPLRFLLYQYVRLMK